MTVQIADTLNDVLQPKGVAVVIEASHQCMTRAACTSRAPPW
jgi:GTP cyclohydrolase IA